MARTRGGLRERKKQATREALSAAALRLALERGPENVRVDDIAEAAGVSPRTYNNYFASREQAIVAAVSAARESRIAAALAERPAGESLADAVEAAVVEPFEGGDAESDAILLITTSPALRAEFMDTARAFEQPLATALAERGVDGLSARVMAAAIAAAIRIAIQEWLRPAASGSTVLVVPNSSLPERIRAALRPLRPALLAAAELVHGVVDAHGVEVEVADLQG